MSDALLAWLVFAAFATAALSSLAGAGGGTVLIGVLFAAGIPPVLAVPLHAVVQLASNASRTVAYAKQVRWRGALIFCLGAVPAPFVVAPLLAAANPDWIRLIMAVFIIWALLPRLAFGRQWSDRGAMGAPILAGRTVQDPVQGHPGGAGGQIAVRRAHRAVVLNWPWVGRPR